MENKLSKNILSLLSENRITLQELFMVPIWDGYGSVLTPSKVGGEYNALKKQVSEEIAETYKSGYWCAQELLIDLCTGINATERTRENIKRLTDSDKYNLGVFAVLDTFARGSVSPQTFSKNIGALKSITKCKDEHILDVRSKALNLVKKYQKIILENEEPKKIGF